MEMLLTRRDGHGVPSDEGGAERVIVLSGAGDGQLVPHGARTVEVYIRSQYAFSSRSLFSSSLQELPTWAVAPTAARARATR